MLTIAWGTFTLIVSVNRNVGADAHVSRPLDARNGCIVEEEDLFTVSVLSLPVEEEDLFTVSVLSLLVEEEDLFTVSVLSHFL